MVSDYDGAWKELLRLRLGEMLSVYFPSVAGAIDWSRPARFLDQELRALGLDQAAGGNRVDLVVEVALRDGTRRLIYLHLEVQSHREEDFCQRVYRCHHQLRASLGQDVLTLVILADLDAEWKPSRYGWELLGCRVTFEFPVCKLLARLSEFEQGQDLASLAAVAQIEALRTSRHPDKRLAARMRLVRKLTERGWKKADIRNGLLLLGQMMKLPEEQFLTFKKEVARLVKEKQMPVLSDIEEYALKQGRQEGLQKGLQKGRQDSVVQLLRARFGRVPPGIVEAVRSVASEKKLARLLKRAALCADLEEFSKAL